MRRPVSAEKIAAELEVSKRTVYLDIAALNAQRVPILGEAGIGYILEPGFDVPPLMLTVDGLDAAIMGASWPLGVSLREGSRKASLFLTMRQSISSQMLAILFLQREFVVSTWRYGSLIALNKHAELEIILAKCPCLQRLA